VTLLVVVIVVALAFDFTNGFHDTANAVATTVSTRALSPRLAVLIAAIANLAGAFVTTAVAKTVGKGIIDLGHVTNQTLLAALLGAIAWNLITWWLGLPSSSSHALIGGLIGAALAASETVKWSGVLDKVIIPMVVSPLVGFGLSYVFMLAVLWIFQRVNAHRAQRGFRWAQILSAATMSFGHGTQDAQKTMGVIALALVVSGHLGNQGDIPLWVIFAAAAAIAAGTYSGGWRIMRTLGRRIISLTPASGFSAQTVASGVMLATANYGLPVSTTHVIASSVMGVGATRRFSAVRWGVAGNIVFAWILTIPAAAAVAALVWVILHPILG
jgi:phosphate/sulfate permease